jgi:hypothetical protein
MKRPRLYVWIVLIALFAFPLAACGSSGEEDETAAVPFALDQRPMPTATDPAELLPETVDGFTRGEIESFGPTEAQVEYTSGDEVLIVYASVGDDAEAAQEGIQLCHDNATGDMADMLFVTGKETSYFQLGQVMCWTRGGYFFSVEPVSDVSPVSFDAFMAAFPH